MTFNRLSLLLAVWLIGVLAPLTRAHGVGEAVTSTALLPEFAHSGFSLRVVLNASLIMAVLLLVAFWVRKPSNWLKSLLFWGIAVTAVISTAILMLVTYFVNANSWSRGPIHWHSDFEIWACGQEINLRDPVGFSNRIGTPQLHEHNDNRIHFEGVVMSETDASVANFFRAVGGSLSAGTIAIPTNGGQVSFTDGGSCHNQQSNRLQAFVYQVNADHTFRQTKVADITALQLSHVAAVPPGACIIIEFSPEKTRTNHVCRSYRVAVQTGKLLNGVKDGS